MAKVTDVPDSYGLMVRVHVLDWKGGIISLLNSAEAKGIIPDAILITKILADEEIEITLWGEK